MATQQGHADNVCSPLPNPLLSRKKPSSVAASFANFCGVNTPAMACFMYQRVNTRLAEFPMSQRELTLAHIGLETWEDIKTATRGTQISARLPRTREEPFLGKS